MRRVGLALLITAFMVGVPVAAGALIASGDLWTYVGAAMASVLALTFFYFVLTE